MKVFLSPEEIKEGLALLNPWPLSQSAPADSEKLRDLNGSDPFSLWIDGVFMSLLKSFDNWESACPILVGSGARYELCPASDMDVLFLGDETVARKIVNQMNLRGLKLRHRVPEDLKDWTVGVEDFDCAALFQARALTSEGEKALAAQLNLLKSKGRGFYTRLFRSLWRDHFKRHTRFDSANYLEPNLKQGPGGLRDINQAQLLMEMYSHLFRGPVPAEQVLRSAKRALLNLRRRLHLMGRGDVVDRDIQMELADWMGESSDFQRNLQILLSEVNFYVKWVFAAVRAPKALKAPAIRNCEEAFRLLRESPDPLVEERVRTFLQNSKISRKEVVHRFSKNFCLEASESALMAFFESGLAAKAVPDLDRVAGLVQFDQYHQLTVRAHILRAVRDVKRAYGRPKAFKKWKKIFESFTERDWLILLWTALYHDIAKGLPGDHSVLGAKILRRDAMDLPKELVQEVAWLVENHLLLSRSAFRENPQSPETWRHLHERGVGERGRIKRLGFFTAIDVLATHPEAWNAWKEDLLLGLIEQMESPETRGYEKLAKTLSPKLLEVAGRLDPSLISSLPVGVLARDLQRASKARRNLEPLLAKSGGRLWIRFHQKNDEQGLLLKYVQTLHATGSSILLASIHTTPELGVYDWFCVRTQKSKAQIQKLLKVVIPSPQPQVFFDEVRLVKEDPREAIISFRGRDQRGALLTAARALSERGFQIRWARVHTWGRLLDDVFSVMPGPLLKQKVDEMRAGLVRPSAG